MTAAVTLDDKYTFDSGRIYATGTQALVRLLLVQRRRDLAAGLNTAGFISGYRGSPMTALDNELWRAGPHLAEHHVRFWPGVNEHLAATAVWGTQQVHYFNDANYDGVFGMWYGKGPGLDQSLDALRQANYHGSAKHGGVLMLVGDDPAMRSTIEAYHSELLFEDLLMPVLYPADIQEVFDFGLYGIALSRFCGAWVGYKLLPETIETAASIRADHDEIQIVTPEFDFPPGGVNSRPELYVGQEGRLRRYKLPAAVAFAQANDLNRITHDSPRARFGIAAMGKTWRDTLQALQDLGLDDGMLAALGIRILKIAMPFPVDEDAYRKFADGLEDILVIEDKREQIENALRKVCYALTDRPRIVGRQDEHGQLLVDEVGDLSADKISRVIANRIQHLHDSERTRARIAFLDRQAERANARTPLELNRLPYFCSGCPHNTSTRVPEGSRAYGGVGCHFMAYWMDRNVHYPTQMGGEGLPWVGQAPFVKTKHVFQQLGDGTYYHSGHIAVRAAVAAGVNITYKILYNDAVAMTGGQPVDGKLTVPQITQQMYHEGVKRIAVVSDEPEKYPKDAGFAPGTTIHHRRDLEQVQRDFRDVAGCTIIVYDQTCAAEKRRRRKRGKYPDPPKRMFINDRVCEGCGDCGQKSNCVSVIPIDTAFGRKRTIDQSSCNKDYSCNNGFCPSFVTVLGGSLRKGKGIGGVPETLSELPQPTQAAIPEQGSFGILVGGVGGTGVITIGALLGMAAHIDGKGVSIVDQMGFAQKGGPVTTHVRIANQTDDIDSARINEGNADLIIGCDMLVVAGDEPLGMVDPQRTRAVINTHQTITGDFTRNADLRYPKDSTAGRIRDAYGEDNVDFVEATRIATALLGDSIASNLFLVGFAWQQGLIPLSREALFEAIALNGVAVEWNQEAFTWGRRAAHDRAAILKLIEGKTSNAQPTLVKTLDELVDRRARDLEDYQNDRYAERYRQLVARVRSAEQSKTKGLNGLTEAVARYGYKLMAYKDEYEVARLHSSPEFKRKLADQFEGNYRLQFNLSPPLLARKDSATGEPRKMAFGGWMLPVFGILAKLKFLRGTPFDLFGYTEERRKERQLIEAYFETAEELIAGLNHESHGLAVEIASLPEGIRGYGYVKENHLKTVEARREELFSLWRSPRSRPAAA